MGESDKNSNIRVTLRIPGAWKHPGELIQRLPEGYRLTPESLRLPDGSSIEFNPLPPDGQFPQIFATSCRRPATDDEQAIVERYSVNVCLSGPGGSMEAALKMMQAGAAVVQAGGAGVFIDNCALAHGGEDWTRMTEDGSSDAISFAFVSIIRGRQDTNTMGMQVLGFPDVQMRSSDIGDEGETIIELIRYVCGGGKPIDVGHILADVEARPRYRVVSKINDDFEDGSPMHNPWGRFKIISVSDIAENN